MSSTPLGYIQLEKKKNYSLLKKYIILNKNNIIFLNFIKLVKIK